MSTTHLRNPRPSADQQGLHVEVFTDPSCPWAWMTARWLKEVALTRHVRLRWRSYCLEIRDEGKLPASVPGAVRRVAPELRAGSHRLLRVFEALRADGNEDAIDALYTEWATRLFPPRFVPAAPPPGLLEECLRACSLDLGWASAADDPSWDAAIVTSMERASSFGGPKAMTPLVVVDEDPPCGLNGPVMAPAPTGEAALRLWDAFLVLVRTPSFFEITRPRQMPFLVATEGGTADETAEDLRSTGT